MALWRFLTTECGKARLCQSWEKPSGWRLSAPQSWSRPCKDSKGSVTTIPWGSPSQPGEAAWGNSCLGFSNPTHWASHSSWPEMGQKNLLNEPSQHRIVSYVNNHDYFNLLSYGVVFTQEQRTTAPPNSDFKTLLRFHPLHKPFPRSAHMERIFRTCRRTYCSDALVDIFTTKVSSFSLCLSSKPLVSLSTR